MKRKGLPLLLALFSGALTALAFPKFNLSFLAWISLIPLFFVLSAVRPRQAFRFGLAAGVAFYGILLYWIPAVPSHYGNLPLWLSVVIYLILILILGGYWAFFGLAFSVLRSFFPKTVFFMAPFVWVSLEYIMTYFLTGFPWGLLGHSQFRDIPFIQLSSWTGVYGLSFVLILLQSAFVLARLHKTRVPFFAALALLAAVHAGGWMSLNPAAAGKNSFSASVIQGNVSSDISWDMISTKETMDIFEDHMDLTRRACRKGSHLIIWPEFTVPLCFSCPEGIYGYFKSILFRFAGENNCTLLLGTNEATGPPDKEQYHNSAICLHPDLSITSYAKMHLVPFGEYMPYQKIFFFIEKLTHAIGDITPGRKPALHEFAGHEFGSPICYEIIFPALVRQFVRRGAGFLTTITNDGWYGRSSAPRQHFAIAVFRAVENRRYLLRAATTGISGIIDPYGRVVAESQLMTRTFLSGMITPLKTMTFYAKHGDVLAQVCLTLSLLCCILCILKKIRKREANVRYRKIV